LIFTFLHMVHFRLLFVIYIIFLGMTSKHSITIFVKISFSLSCSFIFGKGQLAVSVKVHLWPFYSAPLILTSALSPTPYCHDYCSFTANLKVRKFILPLDIFLSSWSPDVHYKEIFLIYTVSRCMLFLFNLSLHYSIYQNI
jgi:hypothetical protein